MESEPAADASLADVVSPRTSFNAILNSFLSIASVLKISEGTIGSITAYMRSKTLNQLNSFGHDFRSAVGINSVSSTC